ncbi:uncharacterized protein LOC100903711 [Galendromus occidentalis]|uniref:Uncharacterized protein LOC100903711 n=1 Tax=Galendromus occidentalis TaxID=34638 RepID=A0AAJ7L4X5_9ACAR|nr:uncharacterized protein LOC100903711 [Galendromus occidentalis]
MRTNACSQPELFRRKSLVMDGNGDYKRDLSPLIEDLRRLACEGDSNQESFETAIRDFVDSTDRIQEIRRNKEGVFSKLYEQFKDHEVASELIIENAELFDGTLHLLRAENAELSTVEERETFLREKSLLEEAIEKYQREISDLDRERLVQEEVMKKKHVDDKSRLEEYKRTLECQIEACMQDFERRQNELKVKQDLVLAEISAKFRARLSRIGELEDHKECASELASWRCSWRQALQGDALYDLCMVLKNILVEMANSKA